MSIPSKTYSQLIQTKSFRDNLICSDLKTNHVKFNLKEFKSNHADLYNHIKSSYKFLQEQKGERNMNQATAENYRKTLTSILYSKGNWNWFKKEMKDSEEPLDLLWLKVVDELTCRKENFIRTSFPDFKLSFYSGNVSEFHDYTIVSVEVLKPSKKTRKPAKSKKLETSLVNVLSTGSIKERKGLTGFRTFREAKKQFKLSLNSRLAITTEGTKKWRELNEVLAKVNSLRKSDVIWMK